MADLITSQDVLNLGPPFSTVFANLPTDEQAALISTASAAVEDFCRRKFTQTTYTETYDGSGIGRIWLRQKPVIAVSAVLINGDALENTYESAWHFNADTGELTRSDGQDDIRFVPWFPRGAGNIQVTYAAGYLDIPLPVKRATILTVRYIYQLGQRTWLEKSESIGDYSYTLMEPVWLFMRPLPPYITGLLANYVQDDGPL